MNQAEFKNLMFGMGSYFGKEVDPQVLSIYWRKLKELSVDDFSQAVDACIMELKWFPKLPEIFERVPEPKALENKSNLSWDENTQILMDKYGSKND
tara:strand:- start:22270 stop:22557 length:288 start_codon:yes stop_codon:yes gene_type:complete